MSTSRDKLIEAAKKLDRRRQIDGDEFYFKKVNEIINDRTDTKKVSELYQHIYMLQHVHRKNGSIIFVVGKSPIDIMEPILL